MKSYSLDDFLSVPSRKESVKSKINLAALPEIDSVRAEAKWTTDMVELFDREYNPDDPGDLDRSSAMARLAYSGAELGWSDEQIMAMLYDLDSRWQKYTARRKETRDNIILNFVNRAREKFGYTMVTDIDLSRFLRDTEAPVVDAEKSGLDRLVWGFQDFVEAEFHVDWMLDGLLPVGGMGFVTGFPGVGKTQFATQVGAYLGLGYDKFLKWDNVLGTRKVLFLSLEMAKNPFHLFMANIGQSYDDKQTLNRNMRLAPLGRPIPFDTKDGQAFLNNLLEEQMPDLLIIDSLQRSISKEMTDELAAKNLMHYLALVREKYKCAVLMIHHNRKKSAEAKTKQISDISDVYGSVFYTADSDFVLSLDKVSQDVVMVHTIKNRLGVEPEPFQVIRDEHLHFSMEFAGIENNFREGGSKLDV